MPLLLPVPHALLRHLLIKLVEISPFFVVVKKRGLFVRLRFVRVKPIKVCGENVFLRFPNDFFDTSVLSENLWWWFFFFWRGKGRNSHVLNVVNRKYIS